MKITRSFWVLADAGPEDEERHEGGGRQIAREGHEGLEEGLDRLVGAHEDAERHRDERASTKPPTTRQIVMPIS
jgi:hypothetical protein